MGLFSRFSRFRHYFLSSYSKAAKDATIFTDNCYLSLNTRETRCNNNVAVIGSSGTGKTRGFVEPNVLQKNASYIISDAKGSVLKDCGNSLVATKNGTESYDIRVLNLHDLTKSMHYNPLKYVRSEDDLVSLSYAMANTTIDGEKAKTNDSFWNTQSEYLIEALAGFVVEERKRGNLDGTMNDVTSLFNKIKSTECLEDTEDNLVSILFRNLEKKNPNSIAVEKWKKMMSLGNAQNTWGCILSSTSAALSPYTLSPMKEILRKDDLDFDSISDRPVALFIVYDDTDPTKNFLSNILYTQTLKLLCHKADESPDGQLKRHVRIFLDDFYSVQIPHFVDINANCRSRNISTCIMLQNESQLEAKYGTVYSSIIDNSNSYLFTGTFDIEAADVMAKRFKISSDKILHFPNNKFLVSCNKEIYVGNMLDAHKHPNYVKGYYSYEPKELPMYFDQIEGCGVDIKEDVDEDQTDEHIIKQYYGEDVNLRELIDSSEKMTQTNILANYTMERFSVFDSNEERLFYEQFNIWFDTYKKISQDHGNTSQIRPVIDIHTPLSAIFVNKYSPSFIGKDRYKLNNMSVDFLLRKPSDLTPIMGIEIDGMQHQTDKDQIKRDDLKDAMFRNSSIPLLRIPTSAVRNAKHDFDKINEAWGEKLLDTYEKAKISLADTLQQFIEAEKLKELAEK